MRPSEIVNKDELIAILATLRCQCGGESGPGARPAHPQWFRSLRDQCISASVPFFFKQWGEYGPVTLDDRHGKIPLPPIEKKEIWVHPDGSVANRANAREFAWPMSRLGKSAAGRLLDGREWSDFPSRFAEVHSVKSQTYGSARSRRREKGR